MVHNILVDVVPPSHLWIDWHVCNRAHIRVAKSQWSCRQLVLLLTCSSCLGLYRPWHHQQLMLKGLSRADDDCWGWPWALRGYCQLRAANWHPPSQDHVYQADSLAEVCAILHISMYPASYVNMLIFVDRNAVHVLAEYSIYSNLSNVWSLVWVHHNTVCVSLCAWACVYVCVCIHFSTCVVSFPAVSERWPT